jgi:hypothetical protein
MTTFEPVKRKHHPGAVRRFQTGLFVWTVLAFLACLYPLIWFAPPYERLTPYIYFAASVMWIRFALRQLRRYDLTRLTIVLTLGALLSTGLFLTAAYEVEVILNKDYIFTVNSIADSPFIQYRGGIGDSCRAYGIDLVSLPHLPVAVLTSVWGFDCLVLF